MDSVLQEKVGKIITAAAAAPSGDNSQPWRFVVRGLDQIEFCALPEKDNALLNVDESGTLIAIGAAIENAVLEAKALGFEPEVQYGGEGAPIAILVLHKGGSLSENERELHQAIFRRHTNRKAYEKKPLTADDRAAVLRFTTGTKGVSIALIEEHGSMARVSRALTTMEEIALSNKTVHQLFFRSIFWSEEHNKQGGSGLYIRTLELPPPARLAFKILRYWPVMSILTYLGFPRVIARTNADQNASASAFGVITLKQFDRASYIEAGRSLERVWLAAVAHGLSLQIVTGLLFIARTIERGGGDIFSPEEQMLARTAYAQVQSELCGSEEPFLAFRLGYARTPSAVSFRRAPTITYS